MFFLCSNRKHENIPITRENIQPRTIISINELYIIVAIDIINNGIIIFNTLKLKLYFLNSAILLPINDINIKNNNEKPLLIVWMFSLYNPINITVKGIVKATLYIIFFMRKYIRLLADYNCFQFEI